MGQKKSAMMARKTRGEKIQKVLAEAGVSSRRGAENLIRQGLVKVNGTIIDNPAIRVDPAADVIEYKGERLLYPSGKARGLILYKISGYVTSTSDPHNRKTVYDLLPKEERNKKWLYAGRLDKDTEGLLFFTDSGELVHRLTCREWEWEDPRTELVEKIVEYMQFKEIAEHMRRLEELSSRQAERGFSEVELYSCQEEEVQIDATVNELILAFGRLLLKKPPPEPVHHILREKISTARRAGEIREMLRQTRRLIFFDLVPEGSSRFFIVVTLVALLEMARGREIKIEQTDPFSQLWIVRKRLKSATVSGGDKPEEPPKDRAGTDSAGSVHLD